MKHLLRFEHFTSSALSACVLALLLCSGCGAPATKPTTEAISTPPPATGTPGEHAHDHPTHGPHNGDLVELGNEEYHAEIVHADSGEVTIYILDSKATTAVPIDAPEIVINLSHDGKAEQFKLPASPLAGEPMGKSSMFMLKNEELAKDLDSEGVAAKLVLTIMDKQYSGKITHSHDHAGHDHAKDSAKPK